SSVSLSCWPVQARLSRCNRVFFYPVDRCALFVRPAAVHVRVIMNPKKRSHRQILSSCNEIGPDDGVDPRTFFRKPSRQGTNRKLLQLCGQIGRTLNSVLAWESGDDLLRDLLVESVEPAPDSTRVLVTVQVQTS